MGYSPRGRKESNMTERLHFHFQLLKTTQRYYLTNLELRSPKSVSDG